VVVAPYYLPATQAGLRDFYTAVADGSPLPILIYDIPELSGQTLALETVVTLADHGRIVGIKDTTRDFVRFRRIVERTPDGFRILQADTPAALPSLDCGADGLVPGSATVLPGVLAAVVDAHRTGDRDRASALLRDAVFPLIDLFSGDDALPAIKFLASAAADLDLGPPLPPLPVLDADRRAALREGLTSIDR
jgi:dihydrodipicolinate synthase/N-acetylneuraminate lyase